MEGPLCDRREWWWPVFPHVHHLYVLYRHPRFYRPKDAGYDQFKYDVQVAKWHVVKNKSAKLFELIGLSKNCTETELKKANKTYGFYLHPDKVENADRRVEAEMLFKLLGSIHEELEKKCELQNQ